MGRLSGQAPWWGGARQWREGTARPPLLMEPHLVASTPHSGATFPGRARPTPHSESPCGLPSRTSQGSTAKETLPLSQIHWAHQRSSAASRPSEVAGFLRLSMPHTRATHAVPRRQDSPHCPQLWEMLCQPASPTPSPPACPCPGWALLLSSPFRTVLKAVPLPFLLTDLCPWPAHGLLLSMSPSPVTSSMQGKEEVARL